MVYSPKTFLKNLFEMLINKPYKSQMACPEVFVVNNPCSCYIDTCSKKL